VGANELRGPGQAGYSPAVHTRTLGLPALFPRLRAATPLSGSHSQSSRTHESSNESASDALNEHALAASRLVGPGQPGILSGPARPDAFLPAASCLWSAKPLGATVPSPGPSLSGPGVFAASPRQSLPLSAFSQAASMPLHSSQVKNPAISGRDALDERNVRQRTAEFPEEEPGYHDYLYYPHILTTPSRDRPAARRVSDETGYLSFLCSRCMTWIRTHTYSRDSFHSLTNHQSSSSKCSAPAISALSMPVQQQLSTCPGVSLDWPKDSFHVTYPYRQHSDPRLKLTWTPPSLRAGFLDSYFVWSVKCLGKTVVQNGEPCLQCLRVLPDIARKRELALADSTAPTTKHCLLTPRQTDGVIAVKQKAVDTSSRQVSTDSNRENIIHNSNNHRLAS
jgi:hypothetical protein